MEYGCTQNFAWRFTLGFQIFFLIIILILVPFYPESPRHLAKSDRLGEAHDLLIQCRVDPDQIKIAAEMEEIKESIRI